jgi:regulator of sirC expression with transglutaminase-like and TPR domain
VLVDPFRAGRTLTIDDCRQILDYYFEGRVPFSPSFLRPVSVRLILARMLYNLRNIFTANHDWRRLATVLQRLASVEPDNDRHLRDLVGLLYHQGDIQMAHAQLSMFLQRRPNANDQFLTRERLAHLEAIIASLN